MISFERVAMLTADDSHKWPSSETEALRLQQRLAHRVIREDQMGAVKWVAGVDAAYDERCNEQYAAAVVLEAGSLDMAAWAVARTPVCFAYRPGLFAFKELPAIIEALKKLETPPDLIVCDAHGAAHPRRFGLASHFGVMLDVPTIGCSKTRLLGRYTSPEPQRGDNAPLVDGGEIIGRVLRTQDGVRPVFVSVGHRVSLDTACDWVLRLTPRYRLPETTGRADAMVRKFLKESR